MRLDLETHVHILIELDDPGVVVEHGNAPGLVDLFRRFDDSRFQKIADQSRFSFSVLSVTDVAAKGLVITVLAPGLGDRLQFTIRRVTPPSF